MIDPLLPLLAQAGDEQSVSGVWMFFIVEDSFGQAILIILWLMSFAGIAQAVWSWTSSRPDLTMPRNVEQGLLGPASQGNLREVRAMTESMGGILGRLTRVVVAAPSGEAARHAADEAASLEWQKLSRPVDLIALMGQVAPMVGLFGTVYGMIRAFVALVESGAAGGGDLRLAAGISTALVTTFWGLVVAIPASVIAQVLQAYLERRLGALLAVAQRLAGHLEGMNSSANNA